MIKVGTCGFSYDDWRGVLYPAKLPKRDFLSWYTRHFSCLELNSSYYAIPSPALVHNLAEKTPDNFQVAVKAFRGITHDRDHDPFSDLDRFLRSIEPLRFNGKLACVLLQFPNSFHYGQPQMDLLARMIEQVQPSVAVVEFRHAGWMRGEVWQWLRGLEAAICCVDEPPLEGLLPPETVMTNPKMGYVRFHGRNSEQWYDHDDPAQRYDYHYPDEQLLEWKRGILWLGEQCEKTFVTFNNHRNGQAVQNARRMMKLLGLKMPSGGENQQSLL
jgi:uncharacterized protein YecE (DUF72 family)